MNNKLFLVTLVLFGLCTFGFVTYVYYNMKNERLEQEEKEKKEAFEIQKFLDANMEHGLEIPPELKQYFEDTENTGDGTERPLINELPKKSDDRLMVIFNEKVFWADPSRHVIGPPQIPLPKIGEGGLSFGGNIADSKDLDKDDKPQTRPK